MRRFKPGKRMMGWSVAAGLIACGALAVRGAETEAGGLDIIKLRPNFYMIAGGGGNVAVQIGVDGVVLVDAGSAAASDQVIAALKKITDLPVRYVINTGAEPDHVGGNGKLAKTGQTI